MEIVTRAGFSLAEVGSDAQALHWLRGGFPLSFLAASDEDSAAWRKNFILTFLERDLPQGGIPVPAPTMLRFWTMLAHYHAQVWNGAELARALGVSEPTVRRYLDALAHGAIILDVMLSYPSAACSGASSTNSTTAVPRIVKWESGNAVRTAPTPQ